MKLSKEQQRKVQNNIRLVYKVISDKVHGSGKFGLYTYDDLFQIGCIGLCKAVLTDKGGTFSTYAYRLIWNEICDALIYATRRQITEYSSDTVPLVFLDADNSVEQSTLQMDIYDALEKAKKTASPCIVKGIDAMVKMAHGYTSKEIGDEHNVSAKLVCAWVSKARKYLCANPELLALISA